MPDPVQKQRAMAGDDKVQTEEGAFGTQEETQTSADPFDTEPTSEDPFLTASDTSSMSDRVESISEEELMDMGKETFAKGDFKGAIAAYSEVIKMDINNATAYYNRGVAYSKLKNREAFINDFKRAAKNGHERAAEYLKSKNIS